MSVIELAFEDLKVYDKTLDFVDMGYDSVTYFPKTEIYGLSSQLIRAATSVALNIAERAGDTNPQFKRFLQVAFDSVKECEVCARVGQRQEFISEEQEGTARIKLAALSKLITSVQEYLKK